ncbi:MAG: hypothetical protein Q8N35_11830 [Methylococcaceae bacterium]|uniref:hypothetical protein n=1 Tax=Methylicorpusculum sp. TaxID=2713644 RepID=UPI002722E158|nr:hypothetical protein [Methylicorpusculum sp.]MDO9161683.1 hypothetical protein [Methylococcaceae bacterium]MDZ4156694.1 hypothetical protein [Methylococcales bacterium]MDP2394844.1 hypothetical protein [Methylococcaceae bacterium]MDP3020265.1 hypothetical protein [Methylococcaceae bacterium]MDP3390806.1 hypothetical protein [Methylococcaceae bacterium]
MDENTKFITVNTAILVAILSILVFPDVLFGLFFELLHLLLEFVHILFEFVESTLDHLIEHLFETDLHATQVIVFYIILSILFFGIVALWRAVRSGYSRVKRNLITFWNWEKSNCSDYWLGLTGVQKISFYLILATGLYLASFLLF